MSDTVSVGPYFLNGLGDFEKSFFNNHARAQDARRLAARGTGAPPTTPDPSGLLRNLRRSAGVARFLPPSVGLSGLSADDVSQDKAPSGDLFTDQGQAVLTQAATQAASDAQVAQASVAPAVQAAGAARAAYNWPLARRYLAKATAAQAQANRANTVATNVAQAVGLARWARRQVAVNPAAAAKTYGVAADKLATAKAVAESGMTATVADSGDSMTQQALMLATPSMVPPAGQIPPELTWANPDGLESNQGGPMTAFTSGVSGFDEPEEVSATLYAMSGARGLGDTDVWGLLTTVIDTGGKVAVSAISKGNTPAPGTPRYTGQGYTVPYTPPVTAQSSLPTVLAIIAGIAVLGGAAYFVMKD